MLQAARRLFLEHGYAATTMPAIAAAAGVSVQSVYKAFGNKAALLKTVFDVAIAGDDEPVPMLQRAPWGASGTSPTRAASCRCTGSSWPTSRPAMSPSSCGRNGWPA